MSNETKDHTYTEQDIDIFRVEFIKFLDKYTVYPKWYEKKQHNGLYLTGHTLQKFLYNKQDKETRLSIAFTADIFRYERMKAKSFYGLLNSLKVEKDKLDELEADKAEITKLYKRWLEEKTRHQQKFNIQESDDVDNEIDPDTEMNFNIGIEAETTPASSAIGRVGYIKETVIKDRRIIDKKPITIKEKIARYPLWLLVLGSVLILFGGYLFFQSQSNSQPKEITDNAQWVPVYKQQNDIRMVYVPSGCFTMGYLHGEASEQPVQRTCLDAFWIAETETTIGQYGETPSRDCNLDQLTLEKLVNEPTPNSPMNCVTWEESDNFCQSQGMRLPTEAEWEYAARGPSNWLYPWGNDPESTYTIVRIDPNAPRPVLPAGSMSRDTSWVGAKDMAGNIREFTSTIHNISMNTHTPFEMPYNPDDGRENPENIGTWQDWSGTTRVVKGGNFDLPIAQARASLRYDEFFDFRFNHYGFRCAMDAN